MGYLFWFILIASLFCKSCEVFCVISAAVLQSHKLHLLNYLLELETLLILRPLLRTRVTSFQNGFLRNVFTLVSVVGRIIIIFSGTALQFLLC